MRKSVFFENVGFRVNNVILGNYQVVKTKVQAFRKDFRKNFNKSCSRNFEFWDVKDLKFNFNQTGTGITRVVSVLHVLEIVRYFASLNRWGVGQSIVVSFASSSELWVRLDNWSTFTDVLFAVMFRCPSLHIRLAILSAYWFILGGWGMVPIMSATLCFWPIRFDTWIIASLIERGFPIFCTKSLICSLIKMPLIWLALFCCVELLPHQTSAADT